MDNNIFCTFLGTPTLSKLLEAPANPYIPSPPQATQKNKLSKCKNIYCVMSILMSKYNKYIKAQLLIIYC